MMKLKILSLVHTLTFYVADSTKFIQINRRFLSVSWSCGFYAYLYIANTLLFIKNTF